MSTPTHVPADEMTEAATGASGITESAVASTPTQKWCRVCKVLMDRGVAPKYHFQTKRHRRALLDSLPSAQRINYKMDELNAASIVDIPLNHPSPRILAELERQKSIGKRMVSIRQRMNSRTALYRREACITNPKSAPDGIQKQQYVIQISALYQTDVAQTVCFHLDLLPVLTGLIDLIRSQRYFDFPVVPTRTITLACSVLNLLCFDNSLPCWHLLFTNDLTILIDCLIVKLTRLETSEFHESVKSLGQGSSKAKSSTAGDNSSTTAAASTPHPATVQEEKTCVRGLFSCLITVLNVLGSAASLNQFVASDPVLAAKSSTAGDTTSNCGPEKDESCVSASNSKQHVKTPAWFRPKAITVDFVAFISNSGLMELITARLSSPTLTNELILFGKTATAGPDSVSEGGAESVRTSLAFLMIEFLTATVKLLPQSSVLSSTETRTDEAKAAVSANDSTYIFEAAAATEVFGLVALLYGVLLCPPTSATSGIPSISRREGWESAESTAYLRTLLSSDAVGEVILAAIRLINGFIVTDQREMQGMYTARSLETAAAAAAAATTTIFQKCLLNSFAKTFAL
ncbi:unnamed protein product [Dibothriocephalus latus]|uniref:U1-type domain-containing protein n=1 Tax=Dibothriocephalus latus TaxID=60516 RepID=A0A3P7MBY0_DIBLA|nr:unnamed protein product [Dibothriocephalus latus]